jgi:predicted MFS family arabinose efflux permease
MQVTDHMTTGQTQAGWNAVYATAFCAAVLVGAEFLPVSLLTPMAADFGVTEGRAGQAISISGVFAVVTSLSVARLTATIDRRIVLAGLMLALLLSSLIVATAANFTMLMAGRALLGVAVGGFWSFATAVSMRLLPPLDVPRGLALIGSAVAISTTIAAPVASNLGEWIGWRGTFLAVVPVTALALIWLCASMPALPTAGRVATTGSLRLLVRPQVLLATIAAMLAFMGQFVIFTYIRPLLETVSGFSVPAMSGVLLVMGLSGVVGSWWVGRALRRSLFRPLILLPALMGGVAVGMIFLAHLQAAVVVLFILWGFLAAAAPVGWGLWLSRALPNEAEAGGGLQVAAIQTAIALGALLGGRVLDGSGWQASIAVGVAVLLAASAAAAATAVHFTRTTSRS